MFKCFLALLADWFNCMAFRNRFVYNNLKCYDHYHGDREPGIGMRVGGFCIKKRVCVAVVLWAVCWWLYSLLRPAPFSASSCGWVVNRLQDLWIGRPRDYWKGMGKEEFHYGGGGCCCSLSLSLCVGAGRHALIQIECEHASIQTVFSAPHLISNFSTIISPMP